MTNGRGAKDAARDRLLDLAAGFTPRSDVLTDEEPLRAHWRLDGRVVRALGTIIGVTLAIVGWSWWNGRPLDAQMAPATSISSGVPSAAGNGSNGGGNIGVVNSAADPAVRAADVVVDVAGDVANPGLFTLPAGSRIADAITAAGGATGKSTGVNLARVLVDGEQVVVGKAAVAAAVASGGPSKVSINASDLAALDDLPGIGPVLAQRIIDWRTAHGPFATVAALGDVPGIGPSVLAKLTPLVTT